MAPAVTLLWCLLGILTAASAVSLDEPTNEQTTEADAYVDKMVKDWQEKDGNKHDPYKLKDYSVGMSKMMVFFNITGEAKLHKGFIHGFSNIHRSGSCSLKRVGDDKLEVRAHLRVGPIKLIYEGKVHFMEFGPSITVHGKVEYFEVTLLFEVDSRTGKNGKLKDCHVYKIGEITITVDGMPRAMNWALEVIIRPVTSVFDSTIRYFVETYLKAHIRHHIGDNQFPIVGNGGATTTTVVVQPTDNVSPTTVQEGEE